MTKYTLQDIKKIVDSLASKIKAAPNLLPTYGYSIDGAHPHIEIDKDQKLHYIIVERGQELERKTTSNIEDLMYWIFDDITFSLASIFELNNRIERQDFRRILFKKQEELLGILNESWKLKEEQDHIQILKSNPFNDENS